MNLARVEHYFSDFLSCLESGDALRLHSSGEAESDAGDIIPKQLSIPANVFFTGTVNIDETTYMFSSKVLDRAFTLELNAVDLEAYGGKPYTRAADATEPLYLGRLPQGLGRVGAPNAQDWDAFGEVLMGELRRYVIELNALLGGHNRQFGYRVANEMARFVLLAKEQASDRSETLRAALDLAVLEKVLPKFHGTQQELEQPLRAVFGFAVTGRREMPPPAGDSLEAWYAKASDGKTALLPRTAAKVRRMLMRLRDQGFTAFIE